MRFHHSPTHFIAVWQFWLLSLLLLTALPGGCQVSVLTQHNDNLRTGANLNETILNTSNVNSNTFGKLFSLPVDGFTYAQPLYVSAAGDPNAHNMVYVATAHDSVYAFDADTGVQLWKTSLGTPVPSSVIVTPNILVEVGIISTPVIDPSSKTLYVVAKTYENSIQIFRLHALDLATGLEKLGGPVLISAQVSGTGASTDGTGHIPFLASQENQRSAVTLVNGVLYLAFASHEDHDPYHGWVLAYNASTLAQIAAFNDTPNGGRGGIWMSGQGLVVDVNNNVYLLTGNSTTSNENSVGDFGESFLKLNLSGSSLAVSDYFKPNIYDSLNSTDYDLGAGGGVGIPGTTYIAGIGKRGVLYLVDTTSMGQLNLTKDQNVQAFQANNNNHGSPVFWNNASTPTLYVWGANETLKAYSFSFASGLFNTTPSSQSIVKTPSGRGNGVLSVSSNGNTAGTGILWATEPLSDPSSKTVTGTLYAFDATNLATPLWNSRQNTARDDFGSFAKFAAPTVANGKVFVGTDSGQVVVYGLLPQPPPTVATAASAAPKPVTGTTTLVSALGADASGENTLTYTWAATGPATVTFSPQGTNAAKHATATFTKAGTYACQVTITDVQGATTTSSVSIPVSQTLTGITLTPSSATLAISGTQTFTASATDQFGAPFVTAPTFTWSVDNGGVGSIDGNALYSAGAASGSAIVRATSSTVSATATVTVTQPAPPISGKASLPGWMGSTLPSLTFTLTPTGTTTGGMITRTVTPAADGSFTLTSIPMGTYTLGVRGSCWLRKSMAVSTTGGTVSGLSVPLVAGDVNGDNVINGLDISMISAAFRSHAGDAKWNANCDLNGDGVVDGTDLSMASANFRKIGDP